MFSGMATALAGDITESLSPIAYTVNKKRPNLYKIKF